jgi:hypothetical protein
LENRVITTAIKLDMSAGYARIIMLDDAPVNSTEGSVPQYQFTFHDGQRDYARTFDEPELILFLIDDLGLTEEVADRVLSELHDKNDVTVPDLHISDNEVSVMGLRVAQSEY